MKVLFVCTGNSCRSQMAEGIFNSISSNNSEAKSAGTSPTSVNPLAIKATKEIGIDISHQSSKLLTQELIDWADTIITVCSDADQSCPATRLDPTRQTKLHWNLQDPAHQEYIKFQEVRDQLHYLITELLRFAKL